MRKKNRDRQGERERMKGEGIWKTKREASSHIKENLREL